MLKIKMLKRFYKKVLIGNKRGLSAINYIDSKTKVQNTKASSKENILSIH